MRRLALRAGALLLLAAPAAEAQAPSLESLPADSLLARSNATPSRTEKTYLRALVARRHPATSAGLAARAWLLDQAGGRDTAVQRLYRAALAADSTNLLALNNLMVALQGEERVRLGARLEAVAPAAFDWSAVRDQYNTLLDDVKDTARARTYLAARRERVPAWVVPLLEGGDALAAKRPAAAESLYARAAAHPDAPWLVHERLLQGASGRRDSAAMRRGVAAFVAAPGRPARERHLAHAWHAERLSEDFGDARGARAAALAAYAALPTSELLALVASPSIAPVARDSVLAMLQRGRAELPWSWEVPRLLARQLLDARADTARVRAEYVEALRLAPTPYDSMLVVSSQGYFLESHALDIEGARRLYERLRPRLVRPSDAIELLYRNSMAAGEWARALRELVELERALRAEGGNPSRTWFGDEHAALARYLANDQQRTRFFAERPLLTAWEAQFGRTLAARIPFAAGAPTVPPAAATTFAAIARLLKEPGADQYVFRITGSAVAGEGDREEVGLARARAVADVLFAQHGVARARMQLEAAPAGARGDRAATIVPVASAGAPRVAATAALMPRWNVTPSPDGRHVAVGSAPAQVWDLRAGTRIRDLGTAGDVYWSPDGRYVAATSNFTDAGGANSWSLFIYDALLGVPAAQLAGRAAFTHLAWEPSGRRLAVATFDRRVLVFDVERRRVVRTALADNRPLHWTADGRRIVSATDSALRVLDAETLREVARVPGVASARRVTQVADGGDVVVLTNGGLLVAVDTARWQRRELRVATHAGDWMSAGQLQPAPTGARVAWLVPEAGAYRLGLVDVRAMRTVAAAPRATRVEIAFAADGSELLEAGGDSLWRTDAATLERVATVRGTAPRARGGDSDQRRGYFLSADDGGVHVWNVATGKKEHVWPEARALLGRVAGDSVFLAARRVAVDGDSVTELSLLRTADFTMTPFARTRLRVDAAAAAGGVVALAGHAWRDSLSDTLTVELYRATGAPLRTVRVPFHHGVPAGALTGTGAQAIAVAPSGARVAVVPRWRWSGFDIQGAITTVLDVATGAVVETVDFEEPTWDLGFADEAGQRLELSGQAQVFTYDLAAGDYVGAARPRIAHEAKVAAGTLQWSENGVELHRPDGTVARAGFPQSFPAIEHFPARNLVVMLSEQNELTFRDVATLETRLTIVSKADNEWLAWAPSGQFATSLAGAEKVFWALGDQLLPFDALRARFEQPEVLTRQLAATAAGDAPAQPRGAAPAIRAEAYGEPFTVRTTAREVRTGDARYLLEVTLEPREKGMPAPALRFRQQGLELPAADSAGKADVVPQADGRLRVRRTVTLAEGLNVLDVDYEFAGAVHRGATVRVRREAGARAGTLPRLFFLGIGTSRYAKPEYDLKFARKDVEDVAAELKAQGGALYSDVNVRLLVDSTATQSAIKREVREFLGQAAAEDVIVIYLSGHGAKDEDETLYYMPHEGDLAAPYTGMEIAFFRNFLRSRPPSQKALFLMDICHAGALGEGTKGIGARNGLAANDAVKLLSEGTGTVIMASSTGRESSLEAAQYGTGNGAFTAAVLELLQGRADATAAGQAAAASTDATALGAHVTVGQLQLYVSRRVPEITAGRQHPTSPLVENLRDYPIAKAGARAAGKAKE